MTGSSCITKPSQSSQNWGSTDEIGQPQRNGAQVTHKNAQARMTLTIESEQSRCLSDKYSRLISGRKEVLPEPINTTECKRMCCEALKCVDRNGCHGLVLSFSEFDFAAWTKSRALVSFLGVVEPFPSTRYL
jgi:hypothetical protein